MDDPAEPNDAPAELPANPDTAAIAAYAQLVRAEPVTHAALAED